ncbi:hypothetical protein WJX73_002645 [Symbiochloris irregularis]|uniref:Uncharacterized protein n=1 Tax=Symbiochloris irregularis TaxID=706552 RepID=A0AAW1NN73_9CHLO
MPPRPARAPAGKAAASTPQALTAAFLLEADAALAQTAPHLAAHLGRQALQITAQNSFLKAPKVSQVCQACGLHRAEPELASAQVIKLSRTQRRRSLKRLASGSTASPKTELAAFAIQYSCSLCSTQACEASFPSRREAAQVLNRRHQAAVKSNASGDKQG